MSPRFSTGQQSTSSDKPAGLDSADFSAELAAEQLTIDPSNADSDALLRRETEYHRLQEKLDQLNLAQIGLVFGRIDVETEGVVGDNPTDEGLDRRYIGRIGLMDRNDDYRSLLIDWRAPMAYPHDRSRRQKY